MKLKLEIGFLSGIVLLMLVSLPVSGREGKLLVPSGLQKRNIDKKDQRIIQSGFHSQASPRNLLKRDRDKPWSLPKLSGAQADIDTLRILALRFDFVYEIPDDPNTTGRGRFDMRDTLTFQNEEGHMIDPSPHGREYFEKHLEALAYYYFFVSEGKLVLEWDVYPRQSDSVYHLPQTMGYYGSVNPYIGLVRYMEDCLMLADTSEPAIDFAAYDSYFLFHAGSDRQNDIGFPPTESDLFTGNVFLAKPIYVDKTGADSVAVGDAVIYPETACQDNRATALNAVMAHEYGHQLGLVDLYNTFNFFTQVGDFTLMDNNGFGTGIDFGFSVGRVFGVMPVYPEAWSRAFLGFVDVVEYRQGTDIELVAAEMSALGTKVAKIPISAFEYYLLENRQVEVDGLPTAILADSATSVILGPVNYNKEFTHEYDLLLPGSGILIWHVDERVAAMDFDGDGYNNFDENTLQVNPELRFLELMEADGLVNFGGYYYSGYGTQQDMYYAGNNSSFTPNTNPPSIGHYGVNSHIRVTDISVSGVRMNFDLELDFVSSGFPQRAGYPMYGLAPISADLDNNGVPEVVVASGRNLLVMRDDGTDFLPAGAPVYDTAYSFTGPKAHQLPLFAQTSEFITAGPVVGQFPFGKDSLHIAVGGGFRVYIYTLADNNNDGLADLRSPAISVNGPEVMALWFTDDNSFDSLYLAVRNSDSLHFHLEKIGGSVPVPASPNVPGRELYGIVSLNKRTVLITGDSLQTRIYLITPRGTFPFGDTVSYDLNGLYRYGPVAVDLDRDGKPEVIVVSADGVVKAVTVDTSGAPTFADYDQIQLEDSVFANPALADLDDDGYADIIIGAQGKIHALDRNFITLLDFPLIIDRAYPSDFVIASPTVADIDGDGRQDVVVMTASGNCYAFGPELLYQFPISAGGIGISPALTYRKSNGGGLGVLGGDGWFYSYDVSFDSARADWPMGGANAHGTYFLPTSKLGEVVNIADNLPAEKFFCYPNPTLDGKTTIRYFLGREASVTLTMYDLSGKEVDRFSLPSNRGTVEWPWNGSALPTGVYRCLLQADFGNDVRSAFTDIAIIK
ncbi:MAG: hypothetical protein HRF51_06060 [bacterium]